MKLLSSSVSSMVVVLILGCTSHPKHDLAHYPFQEAQEELRQVLRQLNNDCATANLEGLRDIHLKSEKFTKFGGGDVYDRMDYERCVETEIAAISSVEEFKEEPSDIKIDVFGDVAVMTYYPHRVVKKDGKVLRYSTRQTLVFLKTDDGWKIVHEHQSPKKYEE